MGHLNNLNMSGGMCPVTDHWHHRQWPHGDSPMNRMTDTHDLKHYLPATSLLSSIKGHLCLNKIKYVINLQ